MNIKKQLPVYLKPLALAIIPAILVFFITRWYTNSDKQKLNEKLTKANEMQVLKDKVDRLYLNVCFENDLKPLLKTDSEIDKRVTQLSESKADKTYVTSVNTLTLTTLRREMDQTNRLTLDYLKSIDKKLNIFIHTIQNNPQKQNMNTYSTASSSIDTPSIEYLKVDTLLKTQLKKPVASSLSSLKN